MTSTFFAAHDASSAASGLEASSLSRLSRKSSLPLEPSKGGLGFLVSLGLGLGLWLGPGLGPGVG